MAITEGAAADQVGFRGLARGADGEGPRALSPGRGFWIPGLTLFLAAVFLRVLVSAQRDGIEVDGITYLRNAHAVWKGWAALDVLHPPLYSLILAPVVRVAADPEWGARLTSAVLGALWVWPTLWLACETTDEDVRWSAGLLVAFFPAAVETSTRVLSEAAYGFFLLVFLAVLARALNTARLWLVVLAGCLGGLATLARPEGMGYLLLAWGVFLITPWVTQPGWTARRVATVLLVLTVTWMATIAPYAAVVRRQTGHWNWSGKFGITLAWGRSVGQEQPARFIEQFLADVRRDDGGDGLVARATDGPWAMVRRVAINLHHMDRYVAPDLLQTGGIALFAWGLLRLRWRLALPRPEWLLPLAALPSAGVLAFVVSPRYFVALLPVSAIIAGIGLARFGCPGDRVEATRRVPAACLALAVVLLSFAPWLIRPWFRHDASGVEKAAALWLRGAVGPGAVFVGRHPRVAFYAEAREVPIAERPIEDLFAEGRKAGARFLIVDNVHLPVLRPDLLPLVSGDPGRHAQALALCHIAEDPSGNRVVVYGIRPDGNTAATCRQGI